LKSNTAEKKKKKQDDKKKKKIVECLKENYQGDIQQSCSMDGAIRNIIGNIGSKWRKTGDDGRKIHSQDITGICS